MKNLTKMLAWIAVYSVLACAVNGQDEPGPTAKKPRVCPRKAAAAQKALAAETSGEVNEEEREGEGDVGEAVEEETAAEPEAARFSLPSLRDVALELKGKQGGLKDEAYMYCLKKLRLADQKEIHDLFGRFRKIDTGVAGRGGSTAAARVERESKSAAYRKKYGKPQVEMGERFAVLYPEYITLSVKGKTVRKPTAELANVSDIISSAESAFESAAQLLMMDKFINWAGKVRGKIYLIVDADQWRLIRPGTAKPRPDQAVITKDENREFFVFVNGRTVDSLGQAVGYAVAQLVLKEYSRTVRRKSESKFPLFFLTGGAVNAGGLESVILEKGPKQLDKWQGKTMTVGAIKALRERSGDLRQLPLQKKDLLSFDRIVDQSKDDPYKDYPGKDEDVYYYMRQSAKLIEYFEQNGPLAFLVMTRDLAKGERLKDAFDDGYVDTRNKLAGRTEKTKRSKKDKTEKKEKKSRREVKKAKEEIKAAETILNGYKELGKHAEEVIFYPLTVQYLLNEKQDAARDAARSKRRPRKKGR